MEVLFCGCGDMQVHTGENSPDVFRREVGEAAGEISHSDTDRGDTAAGAEPELIC